MNEMYWLTRLDAIQGLMIAFAVIAGIALVFYFIGYYVYIDDDSKETRRLRKGVIISAPLALFFTIAACFTPSTKDAMMIYGIGGTIDYVRQNDKAKQLPDKVVDALDRYVDSVAKEEKEEKDEKED